MMREIQVGTKEQCDWTIICMIHTCVICSKFIFNQLDLDYTLAINLYTKSDFNHINMCTQGGSPLLESNFKLEN